MGACDGTGMCVHNTGMGACATGMRVRNTGTCVQTENEYPTDNIHQSADFQPVTIEEPLNLTIERTLCERVAPLNSDRVPLSDKESNLHSKINCPVDGLDIPRGLLGKISPEHLPAFREWLITMGLSKHCVSGLRYSAMIECYNDRTNNLIESLITPPSTVVPPPQTPVLSSDEHQQVIGRGRERHQAMMNLRALCSGGIDGFFTDAQIAEVKPHYTMLNSEKASADDIAYACQHFFRDASFVALQQFEPSFADIQRTYFLLDANPSLRWDAVMQQIQS
jgi:hypothetical protein